MNHTCDECVSKIRGGIRKFRNNSISILQIKFSPIQMKFFPTIFESEKLNLVKTLRKRELA